MRAHVQTQCTHADVHRHCTCADTCTCRPMCTHADPCTRGDTAHADTCTHADVHTQALHTRKHCTCRCAHAQTLHAHRHVLTCRHCTHADSARAQCGAADAWGRPRAACLVSLHPPLPPLSQAAVAGHSEPLWVAAPPASALLGALRALRCPLPQPLQS